MSNDLEIYRKKAEEAIGSVFRSEYHNSLGIPMPIVEMLLPDDARYSTGQYYITIDQTWQIHLNFGTLPKSYKSFQDEVKVLARHEIEHYMCCPFNVITHFRMLKVIRDTYIRNFSNLNIDINKACASIANQAADIIVDTRNFYRHPEETLRSEIDWIKKGADIKKCPKHSKLMFLTKESIWGQSLNINETDDELLRIVNELSQKFLVNGIDDKDSFLEKTEEYTNIFFQLYTQDMNESNNNDSGNEGESESGQSGDMSTFSPQNNNQNSSSQTAGNGKPQNVQGNNAQTTNNYQAGKPKDGDSNGSAFVFSDPDKIKEALETFANETSIEEFCQIISMAGAGGLSKKEKERLWFSVNGASVIPIEEYSNKGNKDSYSYPTLWRIGDPIEDLDMMLTLMNSPKMIPGMTTKKWEIDSNDTIGVEKKKRDLLLVVDTSGSMGNATDSHSNMHQAILAAFGIISYFEETEGKVALLGFSDRISTDIEWTKDYNKIRDSLLTNGQGGTTFPIKRIQNILDNSANELVTVLITDGELGNLSQSVDYFRQYLDEDNRLYVFLLGKNRRQISFDPLKNIGAHIFQAETAEQFSTTVISDLI